MNSGPNAETGSSSVEPVFPLPTSPAPPQDYELRHGTEFLSADQGAAPDYEPEDADDEETGEGEDDH
jgi:hypothetical protein